MGAKIAILNPEALTQRPQHAPFIAQPLLKCTRSPPLQAHLSYSGGQAYSGGQEYPPQTLLALVPLPALFLTCRRSGADAPDVFSISSAP